jgi:hypothetical protein
MAALNVFTPANYTQISPQSFAQVSPIPGAGSATTLIITALMAMPAVILLCQPVETPTGTATAGSLTVTVNSATGLLVGQLVYDSTNPLAIAPGTTIAAINGTKVTLSQPTLAALASDNLAVFTAVTLSSGMAVTANVPTSPLAIGSNTYISYIAHGGAPGFGLMNTVLNLTAGS